MHKLAVNPAAPPDASVTEALEELPVAYVELNAKGVVTRANRAARALYPHEQDKFIGDTLWNFMTSAEKEISRAAFFKIMESGDSPPPIQRTGYTSGGEYRTFELHRSLICDAQGKPAGLRMVTFDVTGAHIAHEEAHQAKKWLESVMASIPEAVIVTDSLGFVRTVNQAAEELLGWKAEELIGMMIEKGLPRLSYTSADQKSLTHRIALEKRTKGIATVLDHARRELRVEISTSPIVDKDSGFTTGVVSVLRQMEEAG
ncbi:MAG: PAS domain-containing protein [Terracidiphilus sp.]